MIDPILGQSRPLVPPIYTTSVYTLPDLDALDRIMNGLDPGFIYARDAHPNAQELARQLAEMEGAAWGLVTGSGMAAITASLMVFLQQGDRVVASDKLYGRTAQLLHQELTRFGILVEFVDPTDLHAVHRALQTPTRILFVESMSNPLLRLVDLDRIADLAVSRQTKLIVDNTFGTPVLYRPIQHGADLVVESLTKMIGGHSDVTLGAVFGHDPELMPSVAQVISIWGLSGNPFDAWQTLRGLPTLELRVRAATATTAALAEWLARQSHVKDVIYPGRSDHPDHALARKFWPLGAGNILGFELGGGRDAVNRFLKRARGIPFSPSLGHTGTTCSYPAGTSHRYVSPAERKRQGITDGLIRLSVGLEPLEFIQQELARGL